jgi:glutamyl-tRNA reductase
MEEDVTNFEDVITIDELGSTPGELTRDRRLEIVEDSPSILRRREEGGSMAPEGQGSVMHPVIVELVKSLAEFQTKTGERSSKSLEQNSKALETISKLLQDVSRSSKRRPEENVEERLLGESPITL